MGTFVQYSSLIESVTNIESVGLLLYTYYFYFFIIASLILLVAMIGAIVLRLVGKQMTQVVSLQTCSWKVAVLWSLLWGFFGQVALLERLVHVVLRYKCK